MNLHSKTLLKSLTVENHYQLQAKKGLENFYYFLQVIVIYHFQYLPNSFTAISSFKCKLSILVEDESATFKCLVSASSLNSQNSEDLELHLQQL